MSASTDRSPFPGLSRRAFLRYCSFLAGYIGLGEMGGTRIAEALAQVAERPVVVWSSYQECTGCAISLLQNRSPSVANLILQQISVEYQENVMAAAGDAANEQFEAAIEGDFYWVVEGGIPIDIPEACMINGETAAEITDRVYPLAAATIAIGSCACYGNIQAARPNPTGSVGVGEYLSGEGGVDDPLVINLSRCPANAEDLVATLSYVLVTGEVPELDAIGRPTFLYGQTIHDTCYRRGHFDENEFVEAWGDEGSQKDWCLYKMGCKGPVTFAPCGNFQWNGNVSTCIHNAPCMGCAEPDFWDQLTPFYEQEPGVQLPGVGGVSAEDIGLGLGIATAAGLGVHAVAQVATGRFGTGAPMEEGEE